ncbi:hypothetical protein [Actinomadura fibrosa]|uniref:ABC transporter permease n=1 Tax=Actinomadura fibrosa TaxID=111802 RepID=A0ABW2Y0Q2_9ACTN|nr:hypothetical protein [Actinomadura fibrosa]
MSAWITVLRTITAVGWGAAIVISVILSLITSTVMVGLFAGEARGKRAERILDTELRP